MFKFAVLCAALAVARAGYLSSAAPSISYSSYAAAPALRYAAAAPAFSYAAAAPAISYNFGYSRVIPAAPAVSYAAPAVPALRYPAAPAVSYAAPAVGYAPAVPALGFSAAPSVGYVGFNAPAIHAAPLAVPVVQQPSILRSFGNLGGYAAPAYHTSYHGNSFGYAAAPASFGYRSYATAAPYAGLGYAGGHGLSYAALPRGW